MINFLKSLKLSQLLVGSLLIVGILPALSVGIISTYFAQDALSNQTYNQLNTIRAIKSRQIETYFADREDDIGVLADIVDTVKNEASEKMTLLNHVRSDEVSVYLNSLRQELALFASSESVIKATQEFQRAFESQGKATDTFLWGLAEELYAKHIDEFTRQFGWYDAFLINLDGDILYTTAREKDITQNVNSELVKGSGLETAFAIAKSSQEKNEIIFGDFYPYKPSGNEPAGFFLTKVFDEYGSHSGYAALQFPIDKISEILNTEKEIHSFMIGSDKHLRTNTEELSVKDSFEKDTELLQGYSWQELNSLDEAVITRNHKGDLVLAIWQKVAVSPQVSWLLYSEQELERALIPQTHGQEFYQAYVEKYGYYDLFLIEPEGEIFYSTAKEADYGTNIVSGKYSDSNLGQLVRDVLSSRQFKGADYAPYEPSGGEPASFIAQPVISSKGDVDLVVSLQLSIEAINQVMALREGMGESGESYLVGPDNLMRSDSYLDPANRSVKASFAGNAQNNGVVTEAANAALSGKTGSDIIKDYHGTTVLSSYAPVDIGDFHWALMVEIDEAEAFAAVTDIRKILIILFVVSVVVTSFIALSIANFIKKPLGGEPKEMIELASRVAGGDLTHSFDALVPGNTLYGSFREMSANLKELLATILESSNGLASTAEETSVASGQTTSAIATQHSEIEQVATAVNQMSSTTKDVAENTHQAALASEEASQRSAEGIDILNSNLKSVRELIAAVNKTTEDVAQLTEKSSEIDKVLTVIQGITEQTNLLALNAAIEAARAGDAGRGFAVVADEVRTLAQKTQDSASEIQTMITDIQSSAESVTANMNISASKAQVTGDLSEKTKDAFDGITSAIASIDDMVSQISAASEEQAQVAEEVNQKIISINEISVQTATSSEQLSAASQDVASSAEELNALSQRFKV